MSADLELLRTIYRRFANNGRRPTRAEIGGDALDRFAERHWLVLDDDGEIEMALPFSGIERAHTAAIDGVTYQANCAWDALGIVAARGRPATVRSRCPDCGDAIAFDVDSAPRSDVLFHIVVPGRAWWDDIRFT